MVEAGSRVLSVSLLLGMDHVQSDLSLADEDFANPLPFEEAMDFLKDRVPITKKEWLDLEPKLRFRAFTVAKLAQYDAIDKVRGKIITAMEKGEGLSSFWDQLEDKSSGAPFYWETVYRTNIQTSYNVGRRMQIEKDKPQALEMIVIEDQRTTKTCLPLRGLVLPADHHFWKSNWPPFHFNCRTTVRPIYKESDEWSRLTNPSMAKLRKAFKPQHGFGKNPLDSGSYWMMLPKMFNQGLMTGAIHEFNFMDNAIADYDKVWPGYKREFTTDKGWVDVHSDSKKFDEFAENFAVAKRLAEESLKVKVLPQHYRTDWKNPDFLIDGKLWELETLHKPTERTISRAVREGQKQAENLVLHITSEMDESVLKHPVFLRLTRKDSPSPVKELIFIRGNAVERYTADFIRNNWK